MNKKVSELLEANELNDEDLLMIIQSGQNKKAKVGKLLPLQQATVAIDNVINASTNYTLPDGLYYKVRQ